MRYHARTAATAWGLSDLPDASWVHQAACSPTTAEWFWPVSKAATRTLRAAQSICAGCPVIDACGEYAVNTGQTEGVWAGLTEEQLRRLVAARGTGRTHHTSRTDGDCLRCKKFRELTARRLCTSCTSNVANRGELHRYPKREEAVSC